MPWRATTRVAAASAAHRQRSVTRMPPDEAPRPLPARVARSSDGSATRLKRHAVPDGPRIAPDGQRRVITVALGRRLGVVRSIGSDRLDPVTVERLGLGGRESRAGGERAGGGPCARS